MPNQTWSKWEVRGNVYNTTQVRTDSPRVISGNSEIIFRHIHPKSGEMCFQNLHFIQVFAFKMNAFWLNLAEYIRSDFVTDSEKFCVNNILSCIFLWWPLFALKIWLPQLFHNEKCRPYWRMLMKKSWQITAKTFYFQIRENGWKFDWFTGSLTCSNITADVQEHTSSQSENKLANLKKTKP